MVAGDEADQAASADAFKVLHLIARARLRRGLLTVIDATNLTRSARGSLLKLSTAATRPAVAVVFDVSLELCLRQNAARAGRQVPEPVVRRHHEQLRIAIDVLQREGYAEIATLRDADMTKP